jgi:hypothetical protein
MVDGVRNFASFENRLMVHRIRNRAYKFNSFSIKIEADPRKPIDTSTCSSLIEFLNNRIHSIEHPFLSLSYRA